MRACVRACVRVCVYVYFIQINYEKTKEHLQKYHLHICIYYIIINMDRCEHLIINQRFPGWNSLVAVSNICQVRIALLPSTTQMG